MPIEDEESIRR